MACVASCGRVGFEPFIGTASSNPDATSGDPDAGAGSNVETLDGSGGMPDATSSSSCVAPDPASATTFPSGAPCTGWGTLTMVAATVQQPGGLQVSPNANTLGAQGYCKRGTVAYGSAGALLHMRAVLSGNGTVTGFQLGSGANVLELVDHGGMLEAQDASGTLATAPFQMASMNWFWVHPNATSTGSVFETSPDGLTWTTFTTSSQSPPASFSVIVIAATLTGGNGAPGTAVFDSFDLCP